MKFWYIQSTWPIAHLIKLMDLWSILFKFLVNWYNNMFIISTSDKVLLAEMFCASDSFDSSCPIWLALSWLQPFWWSHCTCMISPGAMDVRSSCSVNFRFSSIWSVWGKIQEEGLWGDECITSKNCLLHELNRGKVWDWTLFRKFFSYHSTRWTLRRMDYSNRRLVKCSLV